MTDFPPAPSANAEATPETAAPETLQEIKMSNNNGSSNGLPSGSSVAKLLQATQNIDLTDTFVFNVNTTEGPRQVPVTFVHWDDKTHAVNTPEELRCLVVGDPIASAQPIRDLYRAKAAFRAVARLPRWEIVDPAGALLTRPWDEYSAAYAGSFGYVKKGYNGELELPPVEPRRYESYLTAWGQLIKTDGVAEIGEIYTHKAGSTDVSKVKFEEWQKKEGQFATCSFTCQVFSGEGGATVWVGPALKDLAKFFYLLWNLQLHNPELAEEISKEAYVKSVANKRFNERARKTVASNVRAQENGGQELAIVAEINGITLIENQIVEMKFPGANTPYTKIPVNFSDPYSRAKLLDAKDRVENKGYSFTQVARQ